MPNQRSRNAMPRAPRMQQPAHFDFPPWHAQYMQLAAPAIPEGRQRGARGGQQGRQRQSRTKANKGHSVRLPGVSELHAILSAYRADPQTDSIDLAPWLAIIEDLRGKFQSRASPFEKVPSDLLWPAKLPATLEEAKRALQEGDKGVVHTVLSWRNAILHLGRRIGNFQHAQAAKRKALKSLLEAPAVVAALSHAGLAADSDPDAIVKYLAASVKGNAAPLALRSLEQLRIFLPHFLAPGGALAGFVETVPRDWSGAAHKVAPDLLNAHADEVKKAVVAALKAAKRRAHSAPGVQAAAVFVSPEHRLAFG